MGYEEASDQNLLEIMRGGDHASQAYRQLFDRHWQWVFNFIQKRLHNDIIAEDITQDIFMTLWIRRDEVVIEDLGAYLNTASRYAVYRVMQSQKIFVPIEDLTNELKGDNNPTDANLIIKEFFLAFEKTIGTMPPAQQRIFRLHYLEGMSVSEIASSLGIAEKTVRNQLGRATKAFKLLLIVLAMNSNLIIH